MPTKTLEEIFQNVPKSPWWAIEGRDMQQFGALVASLAAAGLLLRCAYEQRGGWAVTPVANIPLMELERQLLEIPRRLKVTTVIVVRVSPYHAAPILACDAAHRRDIHVFDDHLEVAD